MVSKEAENSVNEPQTEMVTTCQLSIQNQTTVQSIVTDPTSTQGETETVASSDAVVTMPHSSLVVNQGGYSEVGNSASLPATQSSSTPLVETASPPKRGSVGSWRGGGEAEGGEKRKSGSSAQQHKKRQKRLDAASFRMHQDPHAHFAESYLMKARSVLSGQDFDRLINTLAEYDKACGTSESESEARLLEQVREVLAGQEDLMQQFLGFVRPAADLEARTDSDFLTRAWALFNSIDSHHFGKMVTVLEGLAQRPGLNISEIETTLRPLFKGQSHLLLALCQLFPSSTPPPRDRSEYETVVEINSDKEVEFEQVWLPRTLSQDRSCPGPLLCSCRCHGAATLCSLCNLRYINGRIYVVTGKETRAAKVHFSYGVERSEALRKLHPTYFLQQQQLLGQTKQSPSKGERKGERKNCQGESKSQTPKGEGESKSGTPTKCDGVKAGDKQRSKTVCQEKSQGHVESSEKGTVGESPAEREVALVSGTEDNWLEGQRVTQRSPVEYILPDIPKEAYSELHTPQSLSVSDSDVKVENALDSGAEDVIIKTEEPDVVGLQDGEESCSASRNGPDPESSSSWTREEDKVILEAFQKEIGTDHIFSKISALMPTRSVPDIQERFHALMRLLEHIMSSQSQT